VQLPLVAGGAEDSGAASVTSPAAPGAGQPAPRLDGLRVLVVDDELDARDIMAATLEAAGARVKLAASAADAFAILEREPLDVLVSDIAMPGEDGFALIRRVRSSGVPNLASIPAAAVTAFTSAEDRARVLAAGFHVYLAKPFEPAQLVRTVDRLINQVVH
jgi:CheY-like chemotaxis protein